GVRCKYRDRLCLGGCCRNEQTDQSGDESDDPQLFPHETIPPLKCFPYIFTNERQNWICFFRKFLLNNELKISGGISVDEKGKRLLQAINENSEYAFNEFYRMYAPFVLK